MGGLIVWEPVPQGGPPARTSAERGPARVVAFGNLGHASRSSKTGPFGAGNQARRTVKRKLMRWNWPTNGYGVKKISLVVASTYDDRISCVSCPDIAENGGYVIFLAHRSRLR